MERLTMAGAGGVAQVHPVGATVVSWVPRGGDDVLWCSPVARFQEGVAVRGGVPLCWPWFADAGQPSHGVVRTRAWTLVRQDEADGDAWSEWRLDHDDEALAPAFTARLTVRVGEHLVITLTHDDRSGRPTTVGGALHSYFRADASRATVLGLQGSAFDKLSGDTVAVSGPQGFASPVDRVVPHTGGVTLDDGRGRRFAIEGRNHSDVVLWNPGAKGASDVPPGGASGFVCVETGRVSAPVTLEPGGRFTLGVRIRPLR